MALTLWALWPVKSVYKRYSQGAIRSGLTGGEVAAHILRRTPIKDSSQVSTSASRRSRRPWLLPREAESVCGNGCGGLQNRYLHFQAF